MASNVQLEILSSLTLTIHLTLVTDILFEAQEIAEAAYRFLRSLFLG